MSLEKLLSKWHTTATCENLKNRTNAHRGKIRKVEGKKNTSSTARRFRQPIFTDSQNSPRTAGGLQPSGVTALAGMQRSPWQPDAASLRCQEQMRPGGCSAGARVRQELRCNVPDDCEVGSSSKATRCTEPSNMLLAIADASLKGNTQNGKAGRVLETL